MRSGFFLLEEYGATHRSSIVGIYERIYVHIHIHIHIHILCIYDTYTYTYTYTNTYTYTYNITAAQAVDREFVDIVCPLGLFWLPVDWLWGALGCPGRFS